MAKIYKTSDRIKISIDKNITITISPLTLHQKSEITSLMLQGQNENNVLKLNAAVLKAISFSLKDIEGLTDSNNNPYKLDFNDNKEVSEHCLDDLSNLSLNAKLSKLCSQLINGVPEDFNIEGVEFVSNQEKKSQT